MSQQSSPRVSSTKVDFLSVSFDVNDADKWRDMLFVPASSEFEYIVTPNVDHIVKLSRDGTAHRAYEQARWRICDSQILNKLARRDGLDLKPYPGSDIVSDLLHDPRAAKLRISVIGPTRSEFEKLAARFKQLDLGFVKVPMIQQGSELWENALEATEAQQADVYLLCISFPKQELFACDLKQRGNISGLALCVGASIDFLTGQQKRAPIWIRKAGLEWLYRLIKNPVRLWKRYLLDAPRIFAIYSKHLR